MINQDRERFYVTLEIKKSSIEKRASLFPRMTIFGRIGETDYEDRLNERTSTLFHLLVLKELEFFLIN